MTMAIWRNVCISNDWLWLKIIIGWLHPAICAALNDEMPLFSIQQAAHSLTSGCGVASAQ